jgi:putative PIN family toxin of toxin-antitoxin system
MRLVLDTNVIISGLLWGGPPRHLLDLAQTSKIKLYTCSQLLKNWPTHLPTPNFQTAFSSLEAASNISAKTMQC